MNENKAAALAGPAHSGTAASDLTPMADHLIFGPMNRLPAIFLAMGLVRCAGADNPDDARWDFRFGRPALDGGALAAVWHDGELFVGGAFQGAGANFAPGVARWDGTNWWPVGEGLSATNAIGWTVTSLAVWEHELYAGGNFVRSGDDWLPGLARWNGTNWSALPGIAAARVRRLLVQNGSLFAAGNLQLAGDTNYYGVARWNGNVWETYDSRIGRTEGIGCIAVRGETVYVSGDFNVIADTAIPYNAYWNGATWQLLPGLTNQTFRTLAIHAGGLYGSGSFTHIGGIAANNLARWDGESWWPVGDGFDQAPDRLLSTPSGLYAVGSLKQSGSTTINNVARWNGSAWQSLGADTWPAAENPNELCLADDGRLFAVGYFFSVQGQRAGHAAEWTGTQWKPLVVNNSLALTDGFLSIFSIAADKDSLFVGGVYSEPAGASGRAVWQLKSNVWAKLGGDFTNIGGAPVIASLVVQNGQLFAGGAFTNVNHATIHHLARWDGDQWQPVGNITNGPIGAMVSDGTNLFIGESPAGFQVNGRTVKRWDGHQWSTLADQVNNGITALAWAEGDLYAGGGFTRIGTLAANRIAVWKNGQWETLGGGMDGAAGVTVQAIVVDGTNVFAGGRFATAGGVAVNNLARWDGAQWHPVGSPPTDGVWAPATAIMALTIRDGNLYVGGFFTGAGGQNIPALARFDGTNWTRLGSGLRGWEVATPVPRVRTMAWQENALWVGGLFPAAGNKSAVSLARWVAHPAMRLSVPESMENEAWRIRASGVTGLRFVVESSTDLQEWTECTRGQGDTDPWEFQDASSSSPRFYRTVLCP